MTLPPSVRSGVERALADGGGGGPERITSSTPVGGGCVHRCRRIETSRGRTLFLKWNDRAPDGLFAAEAEGLRALRRADAIRVPRPLAHGDEPDGSRWLLMEHVGSGPPAADSEDRLGRGLARLHHSRPRPDFGWDVDNWIGSLPQHNGPSTSWADFWRDRRILPQLDLARGRGWLTDAIMDRLVDAVPAALVGVVAPSLLHGDLWSGNTFTDTDGAPVLVDPAVYAGDGEVDLAMTELFGGFGPAFYGAYADVRRISDAYASHRRALYQLYYLLVHVNLFGAAYLAPSRRAAEEVLAAV